MEEKSKVELTVENLIGIYPLLSKSLTRSIRTKTNLNPGSLFVLGILSKNTMLSMSEIGCRLSMPKPHVTAHIDKLIAEDMVERVMDPNDRRIINIRLTEKGKLDFEQIKVEISEDMRSRIQSLEEQYIDQLHGASQLVRELLSQIMTDVGDSRTMCKSSNSN
jgi:DNA-binding MarR family transcriptional regulator